LTAKAGPVELALARAIGTTLGTDVDTALGKGLAHVV
jgi:hypothetical protein